MSAANPVRIVCQCLLAVMLLAPAAGCLSTEAGNTTAEPPQDPRTPDQLVASLQSISREFAQTLKLYKSSGGEFRKQRLGHLAEKAIEDSEKLAAHADSTELQIEAARQTKARFLYQGISMNWPGFEEQLAAYGTELLEQAPDSPQTAIVDAMVLEGSVCNIDAKYEEVMGTLREHTERYPDQPSGMALYHSYAKLLRNNGSLAEAKQCCHEALRLFGKRSDAGSLYALLAEIGREEADSRQKDAELAKLASQLGGYRDGYFVLYVHPVEVKHGTMVDYHVCHGLKNASVYIKHLKKDWVFTFKGRFPDTPDGRRDAHKYCTKLIKENTFEAPFR